MRALLFATAAAAVAVSPRSAKELRDEYESSASRCRHGHNNGVIIHLHADSPTPESYLDQLRQRAAIGDEMRHHFSTTLRAVAAKLSSTSLDQVFLDPHTERVAADCIYYMHKIERQPLGPRSRGASALKAVAELSVGGVNSTAVDSMVASGVLRRDAGSTFWNWGPDRVDASAGIDDAYEFGTATGKGTVLYTIDTGVYTAHEDFGNRIIDGYSIGCPTGSEAECGGRWLKKGFITSDVVANSKFRSDSGEACDSHGTHTASTAAGRLYGVAKEADIVVVQGLDCNGTASNSMFIAALDWAVGDAKRRGKPAVMTMSLGGDRDDSLDQAARRAAAHGFAVVSASGNDGGDSCEMSPGADDAAISVAAVDRADNLASYSNRGKCTNILAPGTGIVAACIGEGPDSAAALSGTSMATPHVAGAVLQLLQKRPKLSPSGVMRALDCMATKGAVHELDASTPDRLLHTGVWLDQISTMHALAKIDKTTNGAITAQSVDDVLASSECHAVTGVSHAPKQLHGTPLLPNRE